MINIGYFFVNRQRKSPDSLWKLFNFVRCCVGRNFFKCVKCCLWQNLNHLGFLAKLAKCHEMSEIHQGPHVNRDFSGNQDLLGSPVLISVSWLQSVSWEVLSEGCSSPAQVVVCLQGVDTISRLSAICLCLWFFFCLLASFYTFCFNSYFTVGFLGPVFFVNRQQWE